MPVSTPAAPLTIDCDQCTMQHTDECAGCVVTFLLEEAVRRTEEAYGIEVPVTSATVETLRERLRPLVADAALRHRVGAASRAYAERLHDIDAIAGELIELYERIRA